MVKTALIPEDIEKIIVDEEYIIRQPGLTICVLTLKNGTKMVGVNYGTIDPKNQDWVFGQKAARKDAFDQAWRAENYLLREQLVIAKISSCFEQDTSGFSSDVTRIQD